MLPDIKTPLIRVPLKIFAGGFYKVHAGLFLFAFLVIFGSVEPGQLLNYHKALMLAFISSPVMLAVVFAFWLLYSIKAWHYITAQLFLPQQLFLFYSINACSKRKQLMAWCAVQAAVLAPVIIYGILAVTVGIAHHYYLPPLVILLYLAMLIFSGAYLYTRFIDKQIDGGGTSVFLGLTSKWNKPFFSLFIYHVFNRMKVRYLITKLLSYLIVNCIFWLFADVQHDARVAGIAVLAIATAHTALIFEIRRFEESYLSFSRNLPYNRLKLFAGFVLDYFILLLPEAIWLFARFNPAPAAGLLLIAISNIMVFHCLLYWMGLNMDRYLQWVMGLFMLTFWIILYKYTTAVIVLDLLLAFIVFYKNYYRTFAIEVKK